MRQEKAHFIQRLVYIDMPLQRRAYHATEQLSDISGVLCVAERHHGFRPWAVPTCGEVFFEEHYTDFLVICNGRGIHMVYLQTLRLSLLQCARGILRFPLQRRCRHCGFRPE